MTTRVSTAGMHNTLVRQMLAQQSKLAATQSQVSSGKRVQSPADDPIAATQILRLQSAQSKLDQYEKNSNTATNRLNITEQALADTTSLLQRVRELAVQANNGTLDATSLKSIATELQSRAAELVSIGNRKDAGGEYLFSGYASLTQPFSDGSSGVTYVGDLGARSLQVSDSQKVADSLNGNAVFMDIPAGNGTFALSSGVHTGTGWVDAGQVIDKTSWDGGSYTIEFTTADTYQVLDASGNAVIGDDGNPVTGTYVDGGTISFKGVQLTVSGSPAAGDTFTVEQAGTSSAFQTVDDLIAALGGDVDTPEGRAQLNSDIAKALSQLDLALSNVTDRRAEVGARLSTLDNAATARDDLSYELSASLSSLQDLDYAEAISRMTQQEVGLQAAQAAYGRIAQLSLFDYL